MTISRWRQHAGYRVPSPVTVEEAVMLRGLLKEGRTALLRVRAKPDPPVKFRSDQAARLEADGLPFERTAVRTT